MIHVMIPASTTSAGTTRAIETRTSGNAIVTGTAIATHETRSSKGLDLPRGLEREIVLDERDRTYELNGEDSRTLATVGAFRVVSESDLRDRGSIRATTTIDTCEIKG